MDCYRGSNEFFNVLTVLPSALFRVQERPLPLTILNVLKGSLTMLATVLLVVVYNYTAIGVLLATLLISFVFGIIFGWITFKNVIWNFNWKQLKSVLAFSLPLVPYGLAYYLLTMSDRLFIERYLGLTQLGVYSTASTLALILNIITYGSYKAFEPYLFKIYGTSSFIEKFGALQKMFSGIVLFVAMAICLFAFDFFKLFASKDYSTVYYYVPFLEVAVVFSSIAMLYDTVITAQGKTKISSIISIVVCMLSVLLNIVLLPIIGIMAACGTSIIVFGIMLLLKIYYSQLRLELYRILAGFIFSSSVVTLFVFYLNITDIYLSIFVKSIVLILGGVLLCNVLKIKLSYLVTLIR